MSATIPVKTDGRGVFMAAMAVAIEILAIVSLSGFYLFPKGQANYFPTYLLGILVLAYFAADGFLRRRLLRSKIFLVATLFTGYLALSSFWSTGASRSDIAITFADWLLIVTMLVAIVLIGVRGKRSMALLWSAVIIAASISAGAFLVHLSSNSAATPAGRISTKSVAAMVYGCALILAISRASLSQPVWVRFLLLVSAPVLLMAVYFCHANYVWVGIFVAASAQVALHLWDRRRENVAYLLLPGLVLLLIATSVSLRVVLSAQRQLMWRPIVTASFNADTAFGHGILEKAVPEIDCQKADWIRHHFPNCFLAHPHNVYISTLYYGGLVGISLLLLCLLIAFGSVFERNSLEARVTVLALLSYGCSVLMFDGNKLLEKVDFTWLLFWLPVGLAAVLEMNRQADD